jgi:hypothetical protein
MSDMVYAVKKRAFILSFGWRPVKKPFSAVKKVRFSCLGDANLLSKTPAGWQKPRVSC